MGSYGVSMESHEDSMEFHGVNYKNGIYLQGESMEYFTLNPM